MLNLNFREYVQEHFKDINIVSVYSQYIYYCINVYNYYVRDNQPDEFK